VLHVTPTNWFSSGLIVSQEGRPVARIRFPWGMGSGEFILEGQTYSVRPADPGLSLYLLETRGRAIARARGWSTVLQRYCVVEHGGRRYHLDSRPGFRRAYVVREGVETVGYVECQGLLARKAVASLPGSLPLPVQVFVIAIVLRLWRGGNEMS